MGIDVHGLNFLRYAKTKKLFGSVMTIGRQGLHVTEPMIKEIFHTNSDYKNQKYCEELLTKYFGAIDVESLDNSNYEGASHVHDMNQPLPTNLVRRFDTVFDGGCLEHIYNAPQALKNCSLLCKPGGQILHVLPANNLCGHGFWQFSPELFFSLYSKVNLIPSDSRTQDPFRLSAVGFSAKTGLAKANAAAKQIDKVLISFINPSHCTRFKTGCHLKIP